MAELPPILGRYARRPVVILVTGRTAVARVGGLTAVGRNVAAVTRAGLDPVIVYPARMPALGAEIVGEVADEARCLASDADLSELGGADEHVLALAGDWFVSPPALIEFAEAAPGGTVARFHDRGRDVAPLGCITVSRLESVIPKLGTAPTGELILKAAGESAEQWPLPVRDRHRLSDTVAIGRCEDKLFALLGTRDEPAYVRVLERYLTIPLAKRLARTSVAPVHIAMLQLALAFFAVRTMFDGTTAGAIIAALAFLGSRGAEALAADLARASVKESTNDRAPVVVLDVLAQIAIVWAIAYAHVGTSLGYALAGLATAGFAMSTYLTFQWVLIPVWRARASRRRHGIAPDNFAARFLRRNGAAWALLLCAVFGGLELFLWAAAIGTHLFYMIWLWQDAGSSMPGKLQGAA